MDMYKTIDLIVSRYQQILQAETQAEQSILDSYRRMFVELVRQYAKVKSVPSKPLTIPAIFNRSYDENFISDYLAYIIHPARSGLGTGPLEAFLNVCQIEAGVINLGEVTIYREFTLENGRIDLVLEWADQFILGIENKIISNEGNQQTQSYARVMEKLYPDLDYCLVYLTRYGSQARSELFQPLSYQQLLDAFSQVTLDVRVHQRNRIIWEDFLEHLEVYIVMSTPNDFEFSEKAKLYMEHRDMLRDLERSFKEDWSRMIDVLEQMVTQQLVEPYWETRFNKSQTYHQVFKRTWGPTGLSVHYEYFFDPVRWEKQKIACMVDIEGKMASEFQEIYQTRYPTLEPEYHKRGIEYLPRNRKIAIAWKEYPIPQDIEGISRVFIEAFHEFRFLEAEIDAVLKQLNVG